MSRLFAFGLGYTALALARRLQGEGWRIAGTTRSAEKQARLAAEGIEARLFERGRPLEALAEVAAERLLDASPLVRAMAVWALAQLLGRDSLAALAARHRTGESDPAVAAEWQDALR